MEMAWDKYIVPLDSFTNLHSEKVTNCYFRTNLLWQIIQHGLKRMAPETKAISN